jgi:outer membrane protein OmpA-like peptidoglycan-associated protein
MDLVASLQTEMEKRRQEEQRRMALEQALAIPLQTGRVTLSNGRIGISGSVLFPVNSDELRPEGRLLLESLVPPLQVYLGERDEMLMVSGFTDDKPIREGNRRFADNLELSAQRALTVTRVLIEEGMPPSRVFSAAFGAEQPVASNADEAGRALNRRVEMAPVPRAVNTRRRPAMTEREPMDVSAAPAAPPLGAESTLLSSLESLRGDGPGRLDPVRLRYLEVLARRMQAAPAAVRLILRGKLRQGLADCGERLGQLQLAGVLRPRAMATLCPARRRHARHPARRWPGSTAISRPQRAMPPRGTPMPHRPARDMLRPS